MGSEAGLRGNLKKKLKNICHYTRVENNCGVGTPDVNVAWGGKYSAWIELKYLAKFPKNEHKKLSLTCFTHDQIKFLLERWSQKQGGSWLLVQVGIGYYLFDARAAAKVYYGITANEFKDLAHWTGDHGWDGAGLLRAMAKYPIYKF